MASAYRGGACGRRHCLRRGRKGRLPAVRPQGAAPWLGLSPERATAGRSSCQQGQRPHKATPPEGNRRLRRGSDGGDGAEGARGVRASFLEKDDPAPINFENFED
ncbi:hypothetical protein GW17_00008146 [Ensete ventricosum]|nr:hypothetical protein GW17_00008146 [Ensete ventricosum]